MKLVYLYLDDERSLFKGRGFCFDSNYSVSHDQESGEIEIKYNKLVSDTFFSVKRVDAADRTDDEEADHLPSAGNIWVSAVVGKNKSGKTSICRALFSIVDEMDRIGRMEGSPWEEELIPQTKYLIVAEDKGRLRVFQNMPGHLKGQDEKSKEEYCGFNGVADLIYYSPYYHSDHYMPVNDEGHTLDISTSHLLFEKIDDEEDNTFVRLDAASLFRFREMERIFEFLSAWKRLDKDEQGYFGLPLPRNFMILPERGAMNRLWEFVELRKKRSDKYKELNQILSAEHTFFNSLIAFVADSLDWHHYSKAIANQFLPAKISDLESSLLDIFIELGKGLHIHPETRMDVRVPADELFDVLTRALDKLAKFGECSLTNDRGSYQDGLKMFDILLSQMQKYPDLQGSYVIVLPTKDDEVLKAIGEVFRLQAESRGRWKTDYIRLSFEYGTSSGEMSFIAMFSRIYHYLYRQILETGVKNGNTLLFLDEAETTLHPEWQRDLVRNVIGFLEAFFPEKSFHVVFASHSPMLVSDVPSGNVVYLDCADNEQRPESFGANIFDLYKDGFFLKNGTVGAFAQKKIDDLVEKVFLIVSREKSNRNDLSITEDNRKLVDLMADKELARYLRTWLKVIDSGKDIIR